MMRRLRRCQTAARFKHNHPEAVAIASEVDYSFRLTFHRLGPQSRAILTAGIFEF